MRHYRIGPVFVLALLVLSARPAAASTALPGGGTFKGSIDEASEVGTWVVPGIAGATLTFMVVGEHGFRPALELVGPAGCGVLDTNGYVSGVGGSKPKLKKFTLPMTGVYMVHVTSGDGSTGGYHGKAVIGVNKSLKKPAYETGIPGSGTVALEFDAVAGSTLKVTIPVKENSAKPRPDRIESPGSTLDLAPYVKIKNSQVSASQVPIASTGTHTLVVRNDGPGGMIVVRLTIVPPKKAKKKPESTSTLEISGLPPPAAVFPFDELSLEVDGTGFISVSVAGVVTVDGVSNGTTFLVPHVPLVSGENALTVRATKAAGGEVEQQALVVRADEAGPALSVNVSPEVAHAAPFAPTFEISLAASAPSGEEILVDADGDGLVDAEMPFADSFERAYTVPGSYRPSVFVRTCDGLLLSAPRQTMPLVELLPAPAEDRSAAFGVAAMAAVDMDRDATSGELFVLSSSEPAVHRFDASGVLLASLALPGAGHEGLGVDDRGDLYVADTANGRVLRMLRETDYSLDLDFGSDGFAGVDVPEGLWMPADIVVANDLQSGEARVYVADAGHGRIVVLDGAGTFLEVWDVGGTLVEPGSLLSRPGGGVVVADRGTSGLQWLDASGAVERALDLGASCPAPRLALRDPATGRLFVCDAKSEQVAVVETNATLSHTFGLPGRGVVAATPVQAGAIERLWVLAAGDAQVRLYEIPSDAQGEAPEDVVAAMVAAVLAEDVSALSPLLSDVLLAQMLAVLGDPTAKAELLLAFGALGAPEVTWRSDEACRVLAGSTGVDPVALELTLARDEASADWVIVRW